MVVRMPRAAALRMVQGLLRMLEGFCEAWETSKMPLTTFLVGPGGPRGAPLTTFRGLEPERLHTLACVMVFVV